MRLRTLLENSGGFVFPDYKYVLTIISVKVLHKCDETSLTVTHIAVNLTFICVYLMVTF